MLRILFAAVLVALAGCTTHEPSACRGIPAVLGEPQPVSAIDSLDPVKDAFNAHADKHRVLLLVSPTCSECVYGAQVVRRSILDRFDAGGVQAIVVWEPMIDSDNEAAARGASGIFEGTPALQFYDPQRRSGWAYEREHFAEKWSEVGAVLPADHWLRQMADGKPEPSPEWDLYMVFKPGVRWEDTSPRPDAFIRHIGRDEHGVARYWRDRFNTLPITGDLDEAMTRMGQDVISGPPSPRAAGIELLGFPGCPHTPAMRRNLIAALESIDRGLTFREVNQEALAATDIRRGWPAPTVLVNGVDLFGMVPPSTPSMGCRMYDGGVPDSATMAARLRKLDVGSP